MQLPRLVTLVLPGLLMLGGIVLFAMKSESENTSHAHGNYEAMLRNLANYVIASCSDPPQPDLRQCAAELAHLGKKDGREIATLKWTAPDRLEIAARWPREIAGARMAITFDLIRSGSRRSARANPAVSTKVCLLTYRGSAQSSMR